MKKFRMLGFILCITTMLLTAGCHKVRQDTRRDSVSEAEPLLVFQFYHDIITDNFKQEYPDIPIEVVQMWDDESYEQNVLKHGNPDIILLNRNMSTPSLEEWSESGYIADITEYFSVDEEFDSSQYFPEAAEVGKIGEALYALPLSVDIPFMTIQEEVWEESAFASMPQEYTGLDLLQAMEEELDKPREEDFWVFQGGEVILTSYGKEIFQDNKAEEHEKEMFNQLYQTWRKSIDNFYTAAYDSFTPPLAPIDPSANKHIAAVYGSMISVAPQVGLVYAQSVTQERVGRDIRVIWFPALEDSDRYSANVCTFGAVGEKSDRKQEAYDVIRKMMDMSVSLWVPIEGDNPRYASLCPIHKERAKEMIDLVENTGVSSFAPLNAERSSTLFYAPKQKLKDDLRAELEWMLGHIGALHRDTPQRDQVYGIMNTYAGNGIEEGFDCYEEIMSMLME